MLKNVFQGDIFNRFLADLKSRKKCANFGLYGLHIESLLFTEYLKKELRPIYENGVSCTTPWMQYFMNDTSEEVPCSQHDARTQFDNVTTALSNLLSQHGKS